MTNDERDRLIALCLDMARELETIVAYSPIPDSKKTDLNQLAERAFSLTYRWTK